MNGLMDFFGFGGGQQAPQVQAPPAPDSGGFLGGQVDPRMLMDLGIGILKANKPSLTPTNLGATLAEGADYMRTQQNTRADQDYKNAMATAAMQKANKPTKNDLEIAANNALLKRAQGIDLSPEDTAAIDAFDQVRTSQQSVDFAGNPFQKYASLNKPNRIQTILGGGAASGAGSAEMPPASPVAPVPPTVPVTSAPLPPMPIDGATPAVQISPQEQAGMPIATPQPTGQFDMAQATAADQTLQLPPALSDMANSPRAQYERVTNVQKKADDIAMQSVADKQKAEENFRQSWSAGKSKMNSNFKQLDKAMESITPWSMGNVGAAMSIMPDSERNTLNNYLLPIKQAVASGELAQMRKDFGSVGQITEKEWARFDSALGSLDTLNDEQLASNLQTIKESWTNISAMNDLRASGVPPEQIEAVIGGDLMSAAQIVAQTGNPITIARNGEILEIDPEFAKQALEASRGR